MTCVWDALIRALKLNIQPRDFVLCLKQNNIKTVGIKCNKMELTEKQMEENILRINEINENNLHQGYDCSTCEPILLLVCKLYNINIEHIFNNVTIIYENAEAKNTLKFQSNNGHFWYIS